MSRASIRVMIADDHDIIRRGIRLLIETCPFVVVVGEASDGLEAVDVAEECQPDIAIIDYSLPHRNGLALAHALRCQLPKIELLMFTMFDNDLVLGEAQRLGIRGFVLKSDNERHLLAALDALSLKRPYYSPSLGQDRIARLAKPETSEGALTRREREVVQLVAEGRVNKVIADCLAISIKTVETHRANVMHKLGLRTTADLVRFAIRNHLVTT